jgi:hypothetical protein
LLYPCYTQYTHANSLIQSKKDSYLPVKLAGELIKQYASKGDVVVTQSNPQINYYSELQPIYFSNFNNESDFNVFVNKTHPRFIMVSIFEYHPPWAYEWPAKNLGRLSVLQAYFQDSAKTKPSLIVYELKN